MPAETPLAPGPQLWAKDLPLDAAVHAFTVGQDPVTDLQLLPYDCLGSAAHARMLGEAGLLPEAEARALVAELQDLLAFTRGRGLAIRPEQEDGHTALEAELTRRLGETGRRIHLGRSRNDQVLTALRLWMREQVTAVGTGVLALARAFAAFGASHADTPLPGYTHLRRAMPSTVGQWATAYAEGLLEELEALRALDGRLDRCPLGAAAGFGAPLPLDRARSAALLGFSRVQRNPMDAMNSRGRHEAALLHALASVAGVLEKACWDLSLYTTEEFGFFQLPDAFTTGSSLMPQKRNPDVLELARGACRELRGGAAAFDHLAGGLPGSYHRDAQLMKAPAVAALGRTLALLDILARVVPGLAVRADRAAAACTDELHAAHRACLLSAGGFSFREAYRMVADELAAGTFQAPQGVLPAVDFATLAADLDAEGAWLQARTERAQALEHALFDWEMP